MKNTMIKQLMLVVSLILLGFAGTAYAGTCEIKQAADTPNMVASPFSLRSVFSAFNADPAMQACKNISFASDVNLEHTIVISGNTVDEDGKRLVITGNNHVINAATSAVDSKGCAIVILSSNVQISDLHILGGGVCIGSDDATVMASNKVGGVTKKVNLTNMFIEKATVDGIAIAKNTANVTIGKNTKIYYASSGAGIHFLENDFSKLIPDSHGVFFTTDAATIDTSVSFYQNGLTVKVEGDSPTIGQGKITGTGQIQGYLKYPDFWTQANNSNLVKDVQMLAYRTNGTAPTATESTLIGIAKVQNGGFFSISPLKQLKVSTDQESGDVISLVPLWSKNGEATVMGTSTPPFQYKLNSAFNFASSSTTPKDPNAKDPQQPGNLPAGVTAHTVNGVTKYIIQDPNNQGIADWSALCNYYKALNGTPISENQSSILIDSDMDGIPDIKEDRNFNCKVDAGETDPANPDTDGDGIMDGEEDSNNDGYIKCYHVEDQGCTDDNGNVVACNAASFTGTKDKLGLSIVDKNKKVLLEDSKFSPVDHKTHLVLPLFNTCDASDTVNCDGASQPLVTTASGVVCTDPNSYPQGFVPSECQSAGSRIVDTATGRHKQFNTANGDFCVELNPHNGQSKDSDGDGRQDGQELWDFIYNAYAPTHLYWMDGTRVHPDSNVDEKCDLSGSFGRKGLKNQLVKDDNGQDFRASLVCASDSIVPAVGNDFKFQFDEANLPAYATDPLDPDTDKDGFCDGDGSNGGCGAMKQDNCATVSDPTNVCNKVSVCNEQILYHKLNPATKDQVLQKVKEFVYDKTNPKSGYAQIKDALIAIDPQAWADSDGDGIPDVIENPTGSCNPSLSEKDYTSNPFLMDSDGDGENDNLDPFPNDSSKTSKNMPAGGNCSQAVSYANHMALYCVLDWDGDSLYNCEENPDGAISISQDYDAVAHKNAKTCPTAKDSDGDNLSDFEEKQIGSNAWKGDTDGDGLTDYQEVYGDGKAGLNLVTSTQAGCYDSTWRYVDVLQTISDPNHPGIILAGFDTDPTKADTDGDGLSDGIEVGTTKTNPVNADSDGDGMCDGANEVDDATGTPVCMPGEVLSGDNLFPYISTDPTQPKDKFINAGYAIKTMPNGIVITSSNPCATDTDQDKLNDWAKGGWQKGADGTWQLLDKGNVDHVKNNSNTSISTPGNLPDRDGDGIPDDIEINQLGTNPDLADTDGDGLPDGCTGMGTPQMKGELCYHVIHGGDFSGLGMGAGKDYNPKVGDTDPNNADTDFDGLKDGDELSYPDNKIKNPYDDKGNFIGFYQKGVNLDPNFYDTDGDGILDGVEAGARFKNNGIGECTDNFCCFMNGVAEMKKEYAAGLNPSSTSSAYFVDGSSTNALVKDTDGDTLVDGSTLTSFQTRNNYGEDLNCNGIVDKNADGNPTESNPLAIDSNHDGINDNLAICRNGICDPAINMPYVYARQVGSGCTNTMLPGETLPATAGDVATLVMMLSPLGLALRMRLRRK